MEITETRRQRRGIGSHELTPQESRCWAAALARKPAPCRTGGRPRRAFEGLRLHLSAIGRRCACDPPPWMTSRRRSRTVAPCSGRRHDDAGEISMPAKSPVAASMILSAPVRPGIAGSSPRSTSNGDVPFPCRRPRTCRWHLPQEASRQRWRASETHFAAGGCAAPSRHIGKTWPTSRAAAALAR